MQDMCAAGLLTVHSYISGRLILKLSFEVSAHSMQTLRKVMHSWRYSEAWLAAGQVAWVKCTPREQYETIMHLYLQGCAQRNRKIAKAALWDAARVLMQLKSISSARIAKQCPGSAPPLRRRVLKMRLPGGRTVWFSA